jgi:hypothetical protein
MNSRAEERNRRREYQQRYREELRDGYVRQTLRAGTILTAKDLPPKLVELQRTRLRLLRACRQQSYGQPKDISASPFALLARSPVRTKFVRQAG